MTAISPVEILCDEQGPDLQKLCKLAGGYHLITSEMWSAFDAAVRAHHAKRNGILEPVPSDKRRARR
jgi:hypothetical protein